MSKPQAFVALGASIEARVFGDVEAAFKEEEALQGGSDIGGSNYGEDHSQRRPVL